MLYDISDDEIIDSIISFLEDIQCHLELKHDEYFTLYLLLEFMAHKIQFDYLGDDKK